MRGGGQVYRVYNEYTNHDGTQLTAVTPPAYSLALRQDFPEVEQTARVMSLPENKTLFAAGKNKFYETSSCLIKLSIRLITSTLMTDAAMHRRYLIRRHK